MKDILSHMGEPLDAAELAGLEARYRDLLGYVSPRIHDRLQKGGELAPDLVRLQEALRDQAMFNPCFDAKTTQLMLFGMLLVLSADAAKTHGWAAYRAGASWEELHAVAGLAFLYRGMPAMNLAGEVWSFIAQHAAQQQRPE